MVPSVPSRYSTDGFRPPQAVADILTFPKEVVRLQVAELASKGIFVGTSSWKYEGWLGLLYSRENYLRYFKQGPPKLLKGRFQKTCLAEYAQTFKTVCLDAGFYQFPSPKMLEELFTQVPDDFRLSLKVTEDITVLRFPTLPRYGSRAGQANPHFLDADLFIDSFLGPLVPYRDRVGTLFFEFSHFQPGDWERGREFVTHLDEFLSKLPKGWDYSVEIRNESLLHPRYFEVLRLNNVAHTFNSWSRMPPVSEQLRIVDCFTADFASARFLLKPGRYYEQAVKAFSPYTEVREPYPDARMALIDLLTTPAKAVPPVDVAFSTGLPPLDEVGIPHAAITEIVSSVAKGPGGGLLLYGLLHTSIQKGERVVLIDGKDAFAPNGLPRADLKRLLWMRCGEAWEAVKAADLAIRDGNMPLVILLLTLNPPGELRRIPATAWHRLQMLAEKSAVTVLIFSPFAQVGCARLRLSVSGAFPLAKLHRCRAELLPALSLQVERRRMGRERRCEDEDVRRAACA